MEKQSLPLTEEQRKKRNQYAREWRAKKMLDPEWKEKYNDRKRKWNNWDYKKNHGRRRSGWNAWYSKNREKCNAQRRRWEHENRDKISAKKRVQVLSIKRRMVDGYGGKCNCCGEIELAFLTADHIAGNGAELRRNGEPKAKNLWRRLILDGFPKEYQVLCWNCNIAKHWYGTCPHQGAPTATV